MKGNRGITLIALVVTIIIILIITSVGVYIGTDSIKHARVVKFVSYMQILQRKVDEIYNNNQDYTTLGQSVQESMQISKIQSILNEAKNKGEINTEYVASNSSYYRYFDNEAIAKDLGLDNIEDEIVVNFQTREVISLTGIEYNKKNYSGIYYTQYLLPTGQKIITKSNEETRNLNFEIIKNIDGLKATIEINNISITNGTLSYKEEYGNWIEISNYTNQNIIENITIAKSGKYIFKLTDNTNELNLCEKDVNLVLTNPPILTEGLTYIKETYDYSGGINSTHGAVATDGTTQYVWVPRFAYSPDKKIRFIKGISSMTTYNESLTNEWEIPDYFSNKKGIGYLESTGEWIKESEIEKLIQVI